MSISMDAKSKALAFMINPNHTSNFIIELNHSKPICSNNISTLTKKVD